MFHVGQLVVRIDWYGRGPATINPPANAALPIVGRIYTVRHANDWGHSVIILLEEIDNRHLIGIQGTNIEPGFNDRGFRPVDDNRIAVFRKALTSVPKPEEVA